MFNTLAKNTSLTNLSIVGLGCSRCKEGLHTALLSNTTLLEASGVFDAPDFDDKVGDQIAILLTVNKCGRKEIRNPNTNPNRWAELLLSVDETCSEILGIFGGPVFTSLDVHYIFLLESVGRGSFPGTA